MTALILVDLQNDFMPGGALAVKQGDLVLPCVNALLRLSFDLVVATQDWHPAGHSSFASTHRESAGVESGQILWPDHCIQGTFGAAFHPGFNHDKVNYVIHKGTEKEVDSYSTFFDNAHKRSTGLEKILKDKKIHTLFLAGLATDYCVKYSALDGIQLGFKVYVVKEGCRGVNLKPSDSDKAFKEMTKAGVHVVSLGDVERKMGVGEVEASFIQPLLRPEMNKERLF